MSKSATEEFTYLEDVQSSSNSSPAKDVAEKKSTSVSVPTSEVKVETRSGTLKRQRTLMEMMSGGSKLSDVGQASKKAKVIVKEKVAVHVGSSPASSPPKASLSGKQSLNSIPFSMTVYLEGLNDEEKRLLALECETMGKSW